MTNTINSVNEVINEVKSLYGSTVNYWGENHTLDNAPVEDDLVIDVADVLQGLADYEFDFYDFISEVCEDGNADFNGDYDDAIDLLLNYGVIESDDYKGDNSFNWSSPINHDVNYEIYKAYDGGIIVTLSVHRFGDVRGNYTDTCILKFDNDYTFFEVLTSCDKYMAVNVDGVDYDFTVSFFADSFEVYNADGFYVCTAYGDSLEDVAGVIREKIA